MAQHCGQSEQYTAATREREGERHTEVGLGLHCLLCGQQGIPVDAKVLTTQGGEMQI